MWHSINSSQNPERSMKPDSPNAKERLWTYVLVATVALLTGIFLGQLGEQPTADSRVNWPHVGK